MTKDTRQRIVQAAMELFWLKGFGSTSIADILSRSQVNSGSLYYFFPGKQDVLVAVLEAYRDGIGAMLLEPAWAGVDDPVERIFALLGSYRRARSLVALAFARLATPALLVVRKKQRAQPCEPVARDETTGHELPQCILDLSGELAGRPRDIGKKRRAACLENLEHSRGRRRKRIFGPHTWR